MSIIKKQEILLPREDLDKEKWAVIACDQFTSEKDYWDALEDFVKDEPSTLHLTFPEIYLGSDNKSQIEKINANMHAYLSSGLLDSLGECMILVNRSTSLHPKRLGIMLNVDLEGYDFTPLAPAMIRATEGTIIERIPPRVEIRKDAPIEFPHIMLLYDDREAHIADTLYENREKLQKVYDFDLNMNGGHITGYKIDNPDDIIAQFDSLLTDEYTQKTFNSDVKMLFAVGDGNHSLATAKEHWNRLKSTLSEEERENHPARFALVEAVNIHDCGIEFEPIYRVVKNAPEEFVNRLKNLKIDGEINSQLIITKEDETAFNLPSNSPLAIKMVQDLIDEYVKKGEMTVDYVHGLDSLRNICKTDNTLGITLPTIDKRELFEFVIKYGVLPRKSFSIGEAREKRYYLEGHKIR